MHYDVVRVYCILLEQLDTLEPHLVLCITNLFHRIMVKRKCEQIFYKVTVAISCISRDDGLTYWLLAPGVEPLQPDIRPTKHSPQKHSHHRASKVYPLLYATIFQAS